MKQETGIGFYSKPEIFSIEKDASFIYI